MRSEDLKKAFAAQNLKLTQTDMNDAIEILDPEGEGIVTFEHFFEVSALHQHQREEAEGDGDSEDDQAAVHDAEVEEAMKLFTNGQNRPITLHDLRQVARTLKEDVDESILRAMILEANGNKGVTAGVTKEDFADLGARAGAFR
jgi:hydroxyacylglutathione hydrolase